ncbi:MAG TPA: serine/threonine-protein kinase [Gemmatimonadaceae bacterium]|jgi:serine/threonine-protein kinase|nr:serine/threonine-protein kinase [Gemmatimonadaceae bacterium]
MLPPDADFIALQTALAGEYSLDREIGRGGMGVVYLAREVRLARPVAIKVLPRALAARPELREAFLREAQTAASLTHPNIVPLYAAGERTGFVYIVMAFVEGTTLGERIRTRGPLLPGQAARVLREVAWALAYAHGAQLVHRDVSAENILLERGSERALVTDFGIASATQTSAVDADGRVMGNAHYVSPEQAAGEPVDARSDLYSLGVAGYYALTGRLPFDGETSAEVVRQHLADAAPSITSVAPSVPPRLAAAVERCLHKQPIRRYPTAESFAEAIDLAFEHAKEIPAPLRVWLSQGQKELPARVAFVGVGATTGITLAYSITNGAWAPLHFALWFLVPFVPLVALSFVPSYFRLRRVLGEGYHVDDLHAAMREHQLALAEEIEYERRQSSPRFRSIMRVLLASSLGGLAIGSWIWRHAVDVLKPFGGFGSLNAFWDLQEFAVRILFFAASGVTISVVSLGGEYARLHLAHRVASRAIGFWKSKWGVRLAKVASLGLKKAERPTLGMPLLTEVALGRATDHLFEALPKASRRELAALPETVRRLETDAGRLRTTIVALDDQLAAFGRGDALGDDERIRVADELRATRTTAAERLATTVTAIETIRLDLLRLQMGSVGLDSVTASLDAARSIGEQIAASLEAQETVERLLRGDSPMRTPDPAGEESDTPVQGVASAAP